MALEMKQSKMIPFEHNAIKQKSSSPKTHKTKAVLSQDELGVLFQNLNETNSKTQFKVEPAAPRLVFAYQSSFKTTCHVLESLNGELNRIDRSMPAYSPNGGK
jgi:hypothetical protein